MPPLLRGEKTRLTTYELTPAKNLLRARDDDAMTLVTHLNDPTMIRRLVLLQFVLLVLFVSVSAFTTQRRSSLRRNSAFTATKRQVTEQDDKDPPKRRRFLPFFRPRPSRLEKFVDKLFDNADTNHDGTVDLTETYEMVLQMYVKLNRSAPIPPPTREKVYRIFRASDTDRNDRISREEFTSLAKTLGRRAMTRLVAHKVVTLIGAPLLTTEIVQILRTQPFVEKRLHKYAAFLIPDRLEAELMSASFVRTALIILFVATLGNITIGIVNFLLDLSMSDEDKETTLI